MAENRVIIEHKDGRSYSVTREAFEAMYQPEGFKITGEETDAAFDLVGVPAPRRPRSRPRSKGAKAKGVKPLAVARPREIEPERPRPSEVISPPQAEPGSEPG